MKEKLTKSQKIFQYRYFPCSDMEIKQFLELENNDFLAVVWKFSNSWNWNASFILNSSKIVRINYWPPCSNSSDKWIEIKCKIYFISLLSYINIKLIFAGFFTFIMLRCFIVFFYLESRLYRIINYILLDTLYQ